MMPVASADGASFRSARDRSVGRVLVTAAILLAIVVSLRYAPPFQAISRDSGVFLYGGHCLTEGKLPYRDFWDHKPPLVYAVDAAGLSLGAGRWGVWGIETALFAGASALFLVLLAQAIGLWPSAAATVFTIAASRNSQIFEGGNLTEGYALIFVMVILAIVSKAPRQLGYWVLLGCFAAIVFFFKPSCLPAPVGLAIVLIVWVATKPTRWVCRVLFSYALGGVLTTIALMSLLVTAGIWRPFWQANVIFPRLYLASESTGLSLHTLEQLMARLYGLGLMGAVFVSILGAVFAIRTRPRDRAPTGKILLAVTILVAIPLELLLISAPGRFYGHYFLTLIPLVGAGIGFGVEAVSRYLANARPTLHRTMRNGVLMVALAAATLAPASSRDSIRAAAAWMVHPTASTNDATIESYLTTRPRDEGLLILGMETRWNFLSDREAPTRYTYITPLLNPEFNQEQRLEEFLDALEKHPNTLLIDTFGLIECRAPIDPDTDAYFGRLRARFPPEWLAQFRATVTSGWLRDQGLSQGWVAWVPRDTSKPPNPGKPSEKGTAP